VLCDILPKDFWTLTPNEYNLLINSGLIKKEARVKEYLDLATFIASLVLNEKADETYKTIFNRINYTGEEEVKDSKSDIDHFIELAKKRGLKTPKGY
jgi:hypothetical protein